MGPTWGPPGADRTQMGPMLAPWTMLSGTSSSLLVQVMSCHLLGTKQLPKPLLSYYQMDHKEHISMKFWIKIQCFSFKKIHWKCHRKLSAIMFRPQCINRVFFPIHLHFSRTVAIHTRAQLIGIRKPIITSNLVKLKPPPSDAESKKKLSFQRYHFVHHKC